MKDSYIQKQLPTNSNTLSSFNAHQTQLVKLHLALVSTMVKLFLTDNVLNVSPRAVHKRIKNAIGKLRTFRRCQLTLPHVRLTHFFFSPLIEKPHSGLYKMHDNTKEILQLQNYFFPGDLNNSRIII